MNETILEVSAFLYRYAELLDGEQFDQWTQLFDVKDCQYRVLSRENQELGLPLPIMGCFSHGMVCDRVAMLAKGVLTYRRDRLLRQVSNVQCHSIGDASVNVRANLVVYQSSEEGVSSLYMVARYQVYWLGLAMVGGSKSWMWWSIHLASTPCWQCHCEPVNNGRMQAFVHGLKALFD
ncbi:MAG: hypothetical protein EBQ82_02565 [Betaproteobacteria bacterium]|nr:hypothetical protein [Betaproteobacteria bacterium]